MATPRIDRLDRNFVINGNMDFWQRVVGTTTTLNSATPTSAYTADRFKFITLGAVSKNFSVQRAADVPTLGQSGVTSTWSSLFTTVTASSAFATGDLIVPWSYTVEGLDYALLHAQTVTLSFWFKSSVGGAVLPVSLRNADGTRSYVTTFTTGAANVWTPIYITVPLDTQGTWNFDNTAGLNFAIGSAGGATYQTSSVGAWQNGNYFSTSATANVLLTAGLTARIAQVQITLGTYSSMPTFRRAAPNLALELHCCQRYFEKSYDLETALGTVTNSGSLFNDYATTGNKVGYYLKYSAYKRLAPTTVLYSTSSGAVGKCATSNAERFANPQYGSQSGCEFFTADGVSTQWFSLHWTADADF